MTNQCLRVAAALSLTLIVGWPAIASGQGWEVEVHGAYAISQPPASGSGQVPPAGSTFQMFDGVQQTRAVSSWFFGDGAALLNQVLQARGLTARVTPLDPRWPDVARRDGALFGVRLTRSLASHLAIEAAVDLGMNKLNFTGGARDRIETTRASFASAFLALNNSTGVLLPNATVTSTATVDSQQGSELIATAAIVYNVVARGRTRPYLLAGGGTITPRGAGPTVTLTGNYQLTNPSQVRFNETDMVTLRTSTSRTPVWLAGGGVRQEFGGGAGVRIDVRVLMNQNRTTMLLSAQPSVVAGSPAGAAVLNTTSPGLQFSTLAGIRTNLSGDAITGFEAFADRRRQMRAVLSVGFFKTF